MNHSYYDAIKKRRSVYSLAKTSPISDGRIKDILELSLTHTPSAFNSQSGRAVLLLSKEHDELWSIVEESLRKIVPPDAFPATGEKIESFRSAYGTVLFFEDFEVVEDLQTKFPTFSKNFTLWSYQSSGMLQNNIWSAFAVEGVGASLQHYNEVIEEQVKKRWDLPEKWKLMSQMPFGTPLEQPGEKSFADVSERLFTFS